jgi:hypothetical protein
VGQASTIRGTLWTCKRELPAAKGGDAYLPPSSRSMAILLNPLGLRVEAALKAMLVNVDTLRVH